MRYELQIPSPSVLLGASLFFHLPISSTFTISVISQSLSVTPAAIAGVIFKV